MISSQLLNRVISDQIEEINTIDYSKLIERDIAKIIVPLLDNQLIKVISGVRRSGKSTLCFQLLKDRKFAYFNFDDERLLTLQSQDLDLVFETLLKVYPNSEFIFFDEIQNINAWELFVNRLQRQGFKIILTGSNSKMLSRELATHLTGRFVQFDVFPFSFNEHLKHKGISADNKTIFSTKHISTIKAELDKYMVSGGFPETYKIQNNRIYLQNLFEMVVLKDIVQRFRIREIQTLKEIALQLINNVSNLYNYNRIKNILNIKSINTTKEFINYLEEAFLIYSIDKFSNKFHETVRSSRKIYCVDNGLVNSLSHKLSENIGRMIENVVSLHLKHNRLKVFYYLTNNYEIDFVAINDKKIINLIQVCYDITDKSTLERELKAFRQAKKDFSNPNCVLINNDIDDEITFESQKIKIVPLWKFLLSDLYEIH